MVFWPTNILLKGLAGTAAPLHAQLFERLPLTQQHRACRCAREKHIKQASFASMHLYNPLCAGVCRRRHRVRRRRHWTLTIAAPPLLALSL